jgi:hypothetical protein
MYITTCYFHKKKKHSKTKLNLILCHKNIQFYSSAIFFSGMCGDIAQSACINVATSLSLPSQMLLPTALSQP